MIFYPNDRTALFIDGANLYATARSLDLELDYKRVRESFSARTSLIRAYYYTAIVEEHDYSPLRPLIDWLDYNGYTIVTKPAKEFTDDHGRRKVKGNMDIEIAVDMLTIADSIDHVILFSGDGDFRRLIEAVQRKGVRTTVISTTRTSPPMIADELRRQADQFVDLVDIQDLVCRDRTDGAARRSDDAESDEEYYEEDYEYEETV